MEKDGTLEGYLIIFLLLFLQSFKDRETTNSAGTHSSVLLFRSEEETWRVFSLLSDLVFPAVYLLSCLPTTPAI